MFVSVLFSVRKVGVHKMFFCLGQRVKLNFFQNKGGMLMTIGKPIESPNAQTAVAWEMAYQFYTVSDQVFMNIFLEAGEKLYKTAREKGALLFKKLTDQGSLKREDYVNYYLPNYTHKTIVEGERVEDFLGHYSLIHTMRLFTAGIVFISNGLDWESVLCIASGQNRPTYIFDARQGTLERTESLYEVLFAYVPEGAKIMAYIVSTDSMPVVIKPKEAEEAKKEKLKEEDAKETKAPKEEDAKETKAGSSKKKKKSSSKKREREESSEPPFVEKKEKEEEEEDAPKKKPVIRRKRLQEGTKPPPASPVKE